MVVAIIGILSAIAIPNFTRYQLRTKTTEAKTLIGGIRIAQEAFRGEMDAYAAVDANPANLPGTVRATWDEHGCPAACSRESVAACTTFSCLGFEPRSSVYYQYQTRTIPPGAATAAEFAVGARGDLDADGRFGSFTLRTANTVGWTTSSLADGVSSCGTAPIPAVDFFDCRPNVY